MDPKNLESENENCVLNKVQIKNKNGEVTKILSQKVALTSQQSPAFDFTIETSDENGEKSTQSILSVNKKDKSYRIDFNKDLLGMFKDKEGKSIKDSIPNLSSLTMNPGSSNVKMTTRGKELVFDFTGEDGEKYKITTSATSISVEHGEQKFDFSTNNENSIDVNMSKTTIEDFIDTNNEIFSTPNFPTTDFPNYLFGLYSKGLTGNTQQKFGDCTFTTINNPDDPNGQPFVFVTKEKKYKNGKVKKENFFFESGYLKRCNNFILQYDEKEGKKEPYIVLEASPQTLPKKDTLANVKYFKIPLSINDNGEITSEGMEIYNKISSVANLKSADSESTLDFSSAGGGTTLSFGKKDERAYAKYKFSVLSKTFEVEEKEIEQDRPLNDDLDNSLIDNPPSNDNGGTPPIDNDNKIIELEATIARLQAELKQEQEFGAIDREQYDKLLKQYQDELKKFQEERDQANQDRINAGLISDGALNNAKGKIEQLEREKEQLEEEKRKLEERLKENTDNRYKTEFNLQQILVLINANNGSKISKDDFDNLVSQVKELIDKSKKIEDELKSVNNALKGTNNLINIEQTNINAITLQQNINYEVNQVMQMYYNSEVIEQRTSDPLGEQNRQQPTNEQPTNEQPTGQPAEQTDEQPAEQTGDGFVAPDSEPVAEQSDEHEGERETPEHQQPTDEQHTTEQPTERTIPQQTVSEQPTEQTPTDTSTGDSTSVENKKKKISLKDKVEQMGNFSFVAGAFLMVASMVVPGVGLLLAGLGAGLMTAGIAGNVFADKFVFEAPIKNAKKKIQEYEEKETEDEEFASNFASKEAELDQARSISAEREQELANIIQNSESIRNFSDIYDQYGVGFEGMIEEGETRTDCLIGLDGLELKQRMSTALKEIGDTTDPYTRSKLVNQFVGNYFENLSKEGEEIVLNIFNPENRNDLDEFTNRLTRTINAEQRENEVYQAQKDSLVGIDDARLAIVINSPKFNETKRKQLFDRYSTDIVNHFATKKELTQESVSRILRKLSPDEKGYALGKLNHAQERLDHGIKNIGNLESAKQVKLENVKDCENYIKSMVEIDNKTINTRKEVEEQTFEYLKKYSVLSHSNSQAQKRIDEIAKASDTKRNATKNQQLKDALNQIHEFATFDTTKTTNSYAKFVKACEDAGIGGILSAFYIEDVNSSLIPNTSDTNPSVKYDLLHVIQNLKLDDNFPDIKESLDNYQKVQKENDEQVREQFFGMLKTFDKLEKSLKLGEVDDIKMLKQVKKLKKDSVIFKHLELEDQLSIAKMQIRMSELSKITKNDRSKELDTALEIYKEFAELTDLVLSGKYQKALSDKAISESLEGEINITDESKNLKAKIKGYQTAREIINHYNSQADANQIIEILDTLEENDGKTAVKKALEQTIASKMFNRQQTFQDIVNSLTDENGKINSAKADKILAESKKQIQNHTQTNVQSLEPVLGKKFLKHEHARKLKEVKNGKGMTERYNTEIDLLVERYDIPREKLERQIATGKVTTEQLVHKFIPKKEINKALQDLRENAYTSQDQERIIRMQSQITNLEKIFTDFSNAWNDAIQGNTEKLSKIVNNKNNQNFITNVMGLKVKEIQKILKSKDSASIGATLQNYDKKKNVLQGLDRILEQKKSKLNQVEEKYVLPTEKDRRVFNAEKKFEQVYKDNNEFKIKVQAIQKMKEKGYTDAEIDEAMKAFVKGDRQFFIEHDEIKCEDGFEFSDEDVQLLKRLGVDGKKLASKRSRKKQLTAIAKKANQDLNILRANVKAVKKEAVNEEKTDTNLDKVKETQVKDNVSILGNIFKNLTRKHQRENGQEIPRQPTAERTGEQELPPHNPELTDEEKAQDQHLEQN